MLTGNERVCFQSGKQPSTWKENIMKLGTMTGAALILGLLLAALSGCEKGPAENAGESIDDAVDKAGESLEDAGDSIRDAGRDASN
jgi:hypothetical protein